jgi:hypothetical protein
MNPQEPQNVELEALVQTGLESNESLNNIEANTEASMLKLDNIESNTEANVLATAKLEDQLKTIAENTTPQPVGKVTLEGAEFVTLKGEKGDKGDTGDKGDQGEKGDKGDKGDTGADSTVQGPVGEKGDRGEKGDTGPAGRDGRDGVDGKDGKDGLDGKDGKTPVKGKDYLTTKEVSVIKEDIASEAYSRASRHVASKTYSLDDMDDVETTGENNNATLQYQTASGKWFTGVAITVSATEPTDPKFGDLWVSLPV